MDSFQLRDDEFMSAMPLAPTNAHEPFTPATFHEEDETYRSVPQLPSQALPVAMGLNHLTSKSLSASSPLSLNFGIAGKTDSTFASTLSRSVLPQPLRRPRLPELPPYYERSTSLVCPRADPVVLRDLIFDLLGSVDCADLFIEQDAPFSLRARALSDCASASFQVHLFQWPKGGVLVEFQRRSGDIASFLGVYQSVSQHADLRSQVDSPAPKARLMLSLPNDGLSLAMPSMLRRPSPPVAPAMHQQQHKSDAAAAAAFESKLSSKAAPESPMSPVTSTPKELISMLQSDMLEHQQQAAQALCHLSQFWTKDTSLPSQLIDAFVSRFRSADFDTARCSLKSVANACGVENLREDISESFELVNGLLDVLNSSSSAVCLREAARAIRNLCASPDVCHFVGACGWRSALGRHCASDDAQLAQLAASAVKSLESAEGRHALSSA